MAQQSVAGVKNAALRAVFAEHWEASMQRAPMWATELGDHRFDDRLGDNSPEAAAAWQARIGIFADTAAAIPDADLDSGDRLSRDLFVEDLRAEIALAPCHFEQGWTVSARGNALETLSGLYRSHPMATPQDGAHLIVRLKAAPAWIDQEVANLRAGLAAGRPPIAESIRRVIELVDTQLAKPDAEWELGQMGEGLDTWPAADRDSFRKQLADVLATQVRPAFQRYRTALRDEVLPKSRPDDKVGVHWLPEGDACYAATIRRHTTMELTAEEVHQTGLTEMARIHAEFQVVGKRLWGIDDLQKIFERLRTDPALHFQSADEVKARAERAVAEADAKTPQYFGKLPKASCGVEPIPDYEAPYTTIAYYRPPALDGSRAGTYYVNTYQPETRPRAEAAVLAYHEAIPGHHFQVALAQELPETPAFRAQLGATAYVEGWALYSERLADEMGLYADDLDRLGMLSFDAWRAGRLVVDTGMHAKGWSRGQAIEYLTTNTPLAENNVDNEVDRYVNWPGQALAYKLGQLEILALRREAEEKLGPKFDLKGFHDVVLDAGPVTMPILRARVRAWVLETSR